MRKLWLLVVLVAIAGISSICMSAACPPKKQCTGEAKCYKDCFSMEYPPYEPDPAKRTHMCSDIRKPTNPGKACEAKDTGDCVDDDDVVCGLITFKECSRTGPPVCAEGGQDTDTTAKVGCI